MFVQQIAPFTVYQFLESARLFHLHFFLLFVTAECLALGRVSSPPKVHSLFYLLPSPSFPSLVVKELRFGTSAIGGPTLAVTKQTAKGTLMDNWQPITCPVATATRSSLQV